MNDLIFAIAGVLAGGLGIYAVMRIREAYRDLARRIDDIERVQKHLPRRLPDNLNISLDQIMAVAIDKYLVEKADLERSETLMAMLQAFREGKSIKDWQAGRRPKGMDD